MEPSPRIVVVCGLITDGEQLLISRRSLSGTFPGYWEFPGGKLESGEQLEEALKRECREELGVDVDVVRQVARVNYPHDDGHITLEVFLCKVVDGQTPTCIEVDEVTWVRPDDLPFYQFPPANGRLVTQLAELEWPDWTRNGTQLWI